MTRGYRQPDSYLPPRSDLPPPLRANSQTEWQQQQGRPQRPDWTMRIGIGLAAALAVLVVGSVGVAIGKATATPATPVTVSVPGPTVTVTKTATAASTYPASSSYTTRPAASKDSRGVSYMKLGWYASDESSRASVRDNWRRLKGTSNESTAITAGVSAFSDGSVTVTRAEVREFLDWTLTN